jgi:hypothetical protein
MSGRKCVLRETMGLRGITSERNEGGMAGG